MKVKVNTSFYYEGKLCDKGDEVDISDNYLLVTFAQSGKIVPIGEKTTKSPSITTKEDAAPELTKRGKAK